MLGTIKVDGKVIESPLFWIEDLEREYMKRFCNSIYCCNTMNSLFDDYHRNGYTVEETLNILEEKDGHSNLIKRIKN